MATRKRLGDILVDACVITPAQLEEALQRQQQDGHRLIGQILVDMGWVTEHEVCRAVSELLRIEYVDVQDALISQDVVQLAPEDLAAKRNILPLFIQDKTLYIAMENPLDVDTIQHIEFQTGMQVRPMLALPSQLRQTIRKHYDVNEYIGGMLEQVSDTQPLHVEQDNEPDEGIDVGEVRRMSEGNKVVRLVNLIISEGIKKRASDVHIEPAQNQASVRYRIDGMLTRGMPIPRWLYLPLISRIKILAGVDITERRNPQDGRFRVRCSKRKIDLRISTLPSNLGEKVVIRILDTRTSSHDLSKLGFSTPHLRQLRSCIHQPQGWVLVTGPTGSGKTTTLYACLNDIKDVTKNIVTVEDPIEYQLDGIVQVQVNPKAGLTFASGLRSILRQDPNVMLVGEIRDAETASIAMQASETGHLVLSTLHTNDALSTVNRLFNLGISPDLVASNLLAVIAQRLVRRICPRCKTSYTPTQEELQLIGLPEGQNVITTSYTGTGCRHCKYTGYYGQIGVYEMFVHNDDVAQVVATRPTKQMLRQAARQAGMQSMLEDGLAKIRQGVTTIEEVARVCPVEACDRNAGIPDGSKMTCQQCRAELERQWNVCPFCGTPRQQVIQQDSSPPEPDMAVQIFSEPAPAPEAIRIVTADDEAHIRDMVGILLKTRGYTAIPAVDGGDALEKIRTELPDLVLLDITMPRKDGFAVCKAVRSALETMFIPVIMLTGQDSIEEKLQGLSSGADDYITKPFDAEELLARIETVLRRAERQRKSGSLKTLK